LSFKYMDTKIAARKIRKFFTTHKRMPSHREICLLFGYATKASSQHLVKKLIEMEILEKDEQGRLLPKHLFPPIPVLGSIQAGLPTPAEEQLLDTMSMGKYLVNDPEKSYILKVSGDSMLNAGINHGDFVVVEKDKAPKNGDIVVAQVDNDFTLKYFQSKNGKIILVPANEKYSPIVPRENLTIFGVVVSVIRKYH
jgi:SOS regulatory protein LexA